MLKDLFKSFLDTPAAAPTGPRPDLATAALFVHVARSDHTYAAEEQAEIDRLLADAFALDPAAATALRTEAEAAEAAAADVVRFTQALKQALDEPARDVFLERIWRVVLADGVRTADEDAFMRKLAGLLHMPDAKSGAARQRALAALSQKHSRPGS